MKKIGKGRHFLTDKITFRQLVKNGDLSGSNGVPICHKCGPSLVLLVHPVSFGWSDLSRCKNNFRLVCYSRDLCLVRHQLGICPVFSECRCWEWLFVRFSWSFLFIMSFPSFYIRRLRHCRFRLLPVPRMDKEGNMTICYCSCNINLYSATSMRLIRGDSDLITEPRLNRIAFRCSWKRGKVHVAECTFTICWMGTSSGPINS